MLGWELPPHNSGGLGVACVQLCRSLSKKGVDITFIVPYTAKHNFDFMDVVSAKIAHPSAISGVYDSADYNEESELSGSVFDIQNRYVQAMENVIKKRVFDVIHAHDWLTFRAGLRARELSGKPLILHVHSIESDRAGGKNGNPLVHDIEYISFVLADKIIAVSQHTKNKIVEDYDIPADKIVVGHNGIDIDGMIDCDADNSYKGISELKSKGYKVVTNIGRLTIQKGLVHLLRAAKMVVEKEPKTIFLIVGSGDQERELIRLSAELGIAQNVIFTGFQRGKRWRDSFGLSDLFVMPSVSEPFGLTPLEAIYYSTPSLISYQSGVSEVFRNCLKVDFWDERKMADQIINAVWYDGFRETLTKNAVSELDHLCWNKTSNILVDIYHEHARGALV